MVKLWRNLAISFLFVLLVQGAPTNRGDDSRSSKTPDATTTEAAGTCETPGTPSSSTPLAPSPAAGSGNQVQELVQALRSLNDLFSSNPSYEGLKSKCDPSMATAPPSHSILHGCRPFDEAAPAILEGFNTWKLVTLAEKAASVAWMVFESSSFTYNAPVKPIPGKGTANMQSKKFNLQYASFLNCFGHVNKNASNDEANKIVKQLVSSNEWNFGSGSWYIHTYAKGILGKENASEKEFVDFLTKPDPHGDDIPKNDASIGKRVAIFNHLSDQFQKRDI